MTDARAPKHVAISGASSGIGRALALHYAADGCLLSLSGRDTARLEATHQSALAAGAAAVDTCLCDVRDAEATQCWILGADDRAPLDIIIACAGIGGNHALAGPLGEDPRNAAMILATNTLGAVHMIAPMIARLAERRRGQIVLIGSLAGHIGLPHSPSYSASKAAIAIYADGLRRFLMPCGVAVTTIHAGYVDTPMSVSLSMKRPFCISGEAAAARIARAVARRRPEYAFPWQLVLCVRAARLVPARIVDLILSRFR